METRYETLPPRCKNALLWNHQIVGETEFIAWAQTATIREIGGIRSVGDVGRRAIARAISAYTGRTVCRLEPAPRTGATKGYPTSRAFIYVMKSARMRAFKVGYSCDVKARLRVLQTYVPDAEVVCTVPGTGADEAGVHAALREFCIGGEWFDAPLETILSKLPGGSG
jgi:hypothetical protein